MSQHSCGKHWYLRTCGRCKTKLTENFKRKETKQGRKYELVFLSVENERSIVSYCGYCITHPPVALMGSFKVLSYQACAKNWNLTPDGGTSVWGLWYISAVSDTSLWEWWIGHVPCGTHHLEYQTPWMISQSVQESRRHWSWLSPTACSSSLSQSLPLPSAKDFAETGDND